MADPRRSLGDPVALLLPRRQLRWPFWAMMALGLYLSAIPLSQRWTQEAAVSCALLGGLAAFGLALFARLHEPMGHLATLNVYVGVGFLSLQLLAGQPGPLWPGPVMIGLAMIGPALSPVPCPDAPPGWFHNPSSWIQRLPPAAFGVLAAIGARSRPAACAAALLALAAVLTGGRRRWRAEPWAAALSGGACAAALGVCAVQLVLAPTPALAAAALACGLMLALTADELRAARLFLRHAPQLGQPLRSAFWRGGRLPEDPFAPRPNRRAAWAPPQTFGRRHGRRRRPTPGLLGRLRGEA